jgi:hypothetical protein
MHTTPNIHVLDFRGHGQDCSTAFLKQIIRATRGGRERATGAGITKKVKGAGSMDQEPGVKGVDRWELGASTPFYNSYTNLLIKQDMF